jgi:hypothetical protein
LVSQTLFKIFVIEVVIHFHTFARMQLNSMIVSFDSFPFEVLIFSCKSKVRVMTIIKTMKQWMMLTMSCLHQGANERCYKDIGGRSWRCQWMLGRCWRLL